ncbi:hypothetical protein NDU88_003191 [Pleurodeles waltl]|uniref:Uncharacterized protein n=1 Tax=Pleurodeles waltl TaxID=8319 RepID=A0AAV7MR26_PLEWA|nr:hypothetical protein NDU88_003191 [Pleurodeles waltl]
MRPQNCAAQQHEQPSRQCPCRLFSPLSSRLQTVCILSPGCPGPARGQVHPEPRLLQSVRLTLRRQTPAAATPQAPAAGPPRHGDRTLSWRGALHRPRLSSACGLLRPGTTPETTIRGHHSPERSNIAAHRLCRRHWPRMH